MACGGDDDEDDEGTPAPSNRLECPGDVTTFDVVGAPVGGPPPQVYATAEEAAQASVGGDTVSFELVGEEESGGVRYAFKNVEGFVVEELVFSLDEGGGGWRLSQVDSCE